MALAHQLLDFEPQLKPQKIGLWHFSGVWAMEDFYLKCTTGYQAAKIYTQGFVKGDVFYFRYCDFHFS